MPAKPAILTFCLLFAGCAARDLQTYEGPAQSEDAVITIPREPENGSVVALIAMDHVTAASMAGVKSWGKVESLRVLPGTHDFRLHWTKSEWQSDYALCLFAKPRHRYTVRAESEGYRLRSWFEDEQTGQRVGGVSGCNVAENDKPELPVEPQRMTIRGASFTTPAGARLRVEDKGEQAFVAAMRDERAGEGIQFSVRSSVLPRFADTEDFVRQVKHTEDERLQARYTVMSHQVQAGSWSGALCARSYWIGADRASAVPKGQKGPLIVESMAILCAHPEDRRIGINVTYSQWHPPGKEDPDFAHKAAALAESLEFEKL
jgi:hypothetical protein